MDARIKYLIDPYIYYRRIANLPIEEFDAREFITKHIKVSRYIDTPQELVNDIELSYVLMGHVPYELQDKLAEQIAVRWKYYNHINNWSEALQVNSAVIAYARDVVGLTDLYSEREMTNMLTLQVEWHTWKIQEHKALGILLDKLRRIQDFVLAIPMLETWEEN